MYVLCKISFFQSATYYAGSKLVSAIAMSNFVATIDYLLSW